MNFLHITYDAILEFTSGRTFQSAEFADGANICHCIRGNAEAGLNFHNILFKRTENGLFLFTRRIDKKRGVCFDFSTFNVSNLSDDIVITIFQKTLKYCVKYFDNLPVARHEKQLPGTAITLVYPYPFVASKEVDKVNIDRNSSKLARKGVNYLTVYYFGSRDDVQFLPSILTKAYEELKSITIEEYSQSNSSHSTVPLDVVRLDSPDLSIDASIGYNQWMKYLTEKQKKFINSEVTGPERVEGAAGTGKTLSMILRCVRILKDKDSQGESYRIIFITHSLATKDRICDIFRVNWPEFDAHLERDDKSVVSNVSINVTTLQEWSAGHLGTNSIFDDNYIDKDASYSKDMQLLYIEQAYDLVRSSENWNGYEPILSKKFKDFLEYTPKENLLEMIQREVAVTIKGRAKEDFDKYKEIKRSRYSIPIEKESDRNFMFQIFRYYQDSLIRVGQYDSDDIILSAMGQIDTPIWRRRRIAEGYDACFIDETHLFNLNELSLFHFINKPSCSNYIVFAVDKSQAVGEWNVDGDAIFEQLELQGQYEKFSTVFRSSNEITRLAFSILSSGATLFTEFENPLESSISNFTREEEEKCEHPIYKLLSDDSQMIIDAFSMVDSYCKKHSVPKSNVLIACANSSLLHESKKWAESNGHYCEALQSRSDANAIRRARDSHKYLLGEFDYVGGLEFDAVVLIGVDGLRVPPAKAGDASHYMRYAWHNRMYVAVTRAKYAIMILGVKGHGPSVILENAIEQDFMDYIE